MLCLYGLENHEFLKNETFFLDLDEKFFLCLLGERLARRVGTRPHGLKRLVTTDEKLNRRTEG